MIGKTIRQLRLSKGMTQVNLSRQSGVDPRTLAAIEKGRIVNPSISSLKKICGAFRITLSELFGKFEAERPESFFLGSQRGEFILDYPGQNIRIVSYFPKVAPIFVGKLIIESHARVSSKIIRSSGIVFLQIILGRLEFTLEEKVSVLKEGQNVLFDGRLEYSMQNPLLRESSALLMTSPSFLG